MARHYEWRGEGLLVSDARNLVDFSVVQGYLAASYWSPGISLEQVQRQLAHSTYVFGLYECTADQAAQPGLPMLGFARVLSDLCRFAYLCDVFILPERQRQGLGKLLLGALFAHPEFSDIRRWVLLTGDAHGLYEQFGFTAPKKPELYMERKRSEPGKWV